MRYKCEIMGDEYTASSMWDIGKMLETAPGFNEGDIIPVYIATGNSGQIYCKMIRHEGEVYRMISYKDKVLKHVSHSVPILETRPDKEEEQ